MTEIVHITHRRHRRERILLKALGREFTQWMSVQRTNGSWPSATPTRIHMRRPLISAEHRIQAVDASVDFMSIRHSSRAYVFVRGVDLMCASRVLRTG